MITVYAHLDESWRWFFTWSRSKRNGGYYSLDSMLRYKGYIVEDVRIIKCY
jgi:hypothetical protein